MIEFPKDAKFGFEKLLLHLIHGRLLDDLDCANLIDTLTFALLDLAQRTVSQSLSKYVAVFELGLVKSNKVSLLDNELFFILDILPFWFKSIRFLGGLIVRRSGATTTH